MQHGAELTRLRADRKRQSAPAVDQAAWQRPVKTVQSPDGPRRPNLYPPMKTFLFFRPALRWRIGCLIVALGALILRGTEAPTWRAGSAVADITPKTNLWLGGYAARVRPAEGIAQPLHAKALALVDAGGHRMVIVTVDAIGVTRTLRQTLEGTLAQSYQLQPHEFVLNASHTHSGPEYRPARVPDDGRGSVAAGQAYAESLEKAIHALVGQALAGLQPARLSYARARAGFAMNRRLPQPNAEPTNAPNPDGPVDPDVPVLRVEDSAGQLRAVLFGYACHNTTLTQTSYRFCGDYAGYAQEYLEADRPGVVAMFLNGASGDQNPYPRGTIELARTHGRTLATAVEAALTTKARPLTGPLSSRRSEIALRYGPPPTRAEFERRLASKDKLEAAHARRMLDRLDRDGKLPESYPYPIHVLSFGRDLTVIALSGEVVVDYSLRLKRELGGSAAVWVAGYCNDVMGYIPTEKVLREGGYEGASAMRLGIHPGPWASGLEDQIVGTARELAAAGRRDRD